MTKIRDSMAQVLKRRGFDKGSDDDPLKPALTEEEHLKELCVVADYLFSTLAYYGAKFDLKHGAGALETSNAPDTT